MLEGVEVNDEDHYQLEDVEEEDSLVDCILQPCCSRSNRRKVAGGRQSILSMVEGRGGGSSTVRAAGRTRTSRWRPAPGGSGRQSTGRGTVSCRGCSQTLHSPVISERVELHSRILEAVEVVELHSLILEAVEVVELHSRILELHSLVILLLEQEEIRS